MGRFQFSISMKITQAEIDIRRINHNLRSFDGCYFKNNNQPCKWIATNCEPIRCEIIARQRDCVFKEEKYRWKSPRKFVEVTSNSIPKSRHLKEDFVWLMIMQNHINFHCYLRIDLDSFLFGCGPSIDREYLLLGERPASTFDRMVKKSMNFLQPLLLVIMFS